MNSRQAWMALIVAATLVAGPAASAAGSQATPFTGVVSEDVEVRAGGGMAFYVVGELQRGSIVEVEEIIFRWYKVRPPEGVYSFISKAFVDVRGDGTRGVVNRDRVEVSAASVRGPGESYRWQADLSEGDEVKIVDEANSFYRIVPPAGAFVFLPPESVRPAEEAEALQRPAGEERAQRASDEQAAADEGANDEAIADAEPNDAADEQQAARPDDDNVAAADAADEAVADAAESDADAEADAAEERAPEAVAAAEPVDTPAITPELREVERAMLPLLRKPIDAQPVDEMIQAYRAVADAVELPSADQRVLAHRLAALERNQRLAQTLARIREVRREADRAAAEDRDLDQSPAAFDRQGFDTVGRLATSGVYDGRRLPRLYRLIDPEDGQTIAYLQPDERIDADQMLGGYVGLDGQRRYDRSLRVHVFDIDAIERLERRAAERR